MSGVRVPGGGEREPVSDLRIRVPGGKAESGAHGGGVVAAGAVRGGGGGGMAGVLPVSERSEE